MKNKKPSFAKGKARPETEEEDAQLERDPSKMPKAKT
jgi:hypothetical protein